MAYVDVIIEHKRTGRLTCALTPTISARGSLITSGTLHGHCVAILRRCEKGRTGPNDELRGRTSRVISRMLYDVHFNDRYFTAHMSGCSIKGGSQLSRLVGSQNPTGFKVLLYHAVLPRCHFSRSHCVCSECCYIRSRAWKDSCRRKARILHHRETREPFVLVSLSCPHYMQRFLSCRIL